MCIGKVSGVCTMNVAKEPRQFGRRENRVTITTNGKIREYRISANILIFSAVLFCTFMTGYIGATAYLAFREDLVAGTLIRQARMQHEYEDRIAALRSRVDRITSRQLLDQQAVEAKVAALMRQQEMLSGRNGAIDGLMEKARKNGLDVPAAPKPEQKAEIGASEIPGIDAITTGSISNDRRPTIVALADAGSFLRGSTFAGQSGSQIDLGSDLAMAETPSALTSASQASVLASRRMFDDVRKQIETVEQHQTASLLAVQLAARNRMEKLAAVYDRLNIALPADMTANTGGPFVASSDIAFEDLAENVALSLDTLASLKQQANKLPVANPLPGAKVTSNFGSRIDPFNRRSAFHAGIDFRAGRGTPVKATGSGRVVHAGRKGGYGMMVEIDHGNGITTRYAHLSRILVKQGSRVKPGDTIGKVGSTGRSTGPHLHYEVRRNEKATNPARFLKAGREIATL